MTPRKISVAARRVTASLQEDGGRKKLAAKPLSAAERRRRKAAKIRAELLAFKVRHALTWDELVYVMKHSDARVVISVPTLKRLALAYVAPQFSTLKLIEAFLALSREMERKDKRV